MGLLKEKNHGDALHAELEEFVANHQERVRSRRETVKSRLAELEAEHAALEETDRRLAHLS